MASKGMKIAEALKHLGLENTADANDVKQAYRDLAKIWHPDRFQNDERVGAKAEAQIKIINEAKTVALAYVEKYGHFRHVRDENAGASMGFEPPKPPPRYRQQQERPRPRPRPEPEPEPEPPPKQEPPKPPPPPKEKPKPEPDIFEESMSFGDFMPGSTTLFVAAILIILVSFFFMLSSSLFNSPVERYKQYTEKSDNQSAALARARKKEAEKPKPKPVVPAASTTEAAALDTFFTLGSDKDWVSTVQGPPLQIKGLEWRYGFSTVQFDGDKVVSWSSSELNPLKVGMILDPNRFYSDRYFGVGSKKDEVAAIQGAPDIIEPNRWTYGEAWVEFDSDTVVTWQNDATIRLAIRY